MGLSTHPASEIQRGKKKKKKSCVSSSLKVGSFPSLSHPAFLSHVVQPAQSATGTRTCLKTLLWVTCSTTTPGNCRGPQAKIITGQCLTLIAFLNQGYGVPFRFLVSGFSSFPPWHSKAVSSTHTTHPVLPCS